MQPSAGVREAMLLFYDRFSAGDVASFARSLSREADSMVIGTSPTEWYEGRDRWIAAYEEQITAIPGIRLEAGEVRGWEDGSVGWAADRPRFVLPNGLALPGRLTAVLRREDGEWKLAQAHFSVGVPDETALELATQGAS
jgi:ketosteroid isomerase-like protein